MPPVISFPRSAWVKRNLIRTGIGLFRAETYKWSMTSSVACECGAKKQTAKHVIISCTIYHHLNGTRALLDVHKSLVT